jgi:hypothetical protein
MIVLNFGNNRVYRNLFVEKKMASEAYLFVRDHLNRLESSLFTVTLDLESVADVVEHNEFENEVLVELAARLLTWLPVFPKRESLLFTLSAFLCKSVDWSEFDFQLLLDVLPDLQVLELHHALFILGSSFNADYVPILESYLTHANEGVRGSAEDALTELRYTP